MKNILIIDALPGSESIIENIRKQNKTRLYNIFYSSNLSETTKIIHDESLDLIFVNKNSLDHKISEVIHNQLQKQIFFYDNILTIYDSLFGKV